MIDAGLAGDWTARGGASVVGVERCRSGSRREHAGVGVVSERLLGHAPVIVGESDARRVLLVKDLSTGGIDGGAIARWGCWALRDRRALSPNCKKPGGRVTLEFTYQPAAVHPYGWDAER
jgi:hypothetical protein